MSKLKREIQRLQHLNDLWEQKHPDFCLISKPYVQGLREKVAKLRGFDVGDKPCGTCDIYPGDSRCTDCDHYTGK